MLTDYYFPFIRKRKTKAYNIFYYQCIDIFMWKKVKYGKKINYITNPTSHRYQGLYQ